MISRRQIIEQQKVTDARSAQGRIGSRSPGERRTNQQGSRQAKSSLEADEMCPDDKNCVRNQLYATSENRVVSRSYHLNGIERFELPYERVDVASPPSSDQLYQSSNGNDHEDDLYRQSLLSDALGGRKSIGDQRQEVDKHRFQEQLTKQLQANRRQQLLNTTTPGQAKKMQHDDENILKQMGGHARFFNKHQMANEIISHSNSYCGSTSNTKTKTSPINEPFDNYQNFDPYSVFADDDDEDDVWYSDEQLFQDHIQEIVDKWHSIDDEIWAKIICLERNRRIAKAYARQHQLNVNGSQVEYVDGKTLGLDAFENQARDARTSHIKQYIGQGIQLNICQNGNIFVKRLSKANVYIHWLTKKTTTTTDLDAHFINKSQSAQAESEFYGVVSQKMVKNYPNQFNRLSSNVSKVDLTKAGKNQFNYHKESYLTSKMSLINQQSSSGISSSSSSANSSKNVSKDSRRENMTRHTDSESSHVKNHYQISKSFELIELNKLIKVFDMDAFKLDLEYESRKMCPDRTRLRNMCISIISFVLSDEKLLNLPSWIMVINIVALDLLNSEIGLVDPHDYTRLTQKNCTTELECDNDLDLGDYNLIDQDLDYHLSVTENNNNHNNNRHLKKQFKDEAKRALENAAASSGQNAHNKPTKSREAIESSRQNQLRIINNDVKQTSASSSGFESHSSPSPTRNIKNYSVAIKGDNMQKNLHPPLGSRAKRPPKMPQAPANSQNVSLLQPEVPTPQLKQQVIDISHNPTVVSGPIQIPAPPTSFGTGPSGCANLILVSPTGLSPPMLKRRTGRMDRGPTSGHLVEQGDGTNRKYYMTNQLAQRGQLSTNNTGKKKHLQLPAGIPAHAQLAPPVTQKHILRYLKQSGASKTITDCNKLPPLPVALKPYQRPLPVLPPISKRKLSSKSIDESLYYCGLQARVPTFKSPATPNSYNYHQMMPSRQIVNGTNRNNTDHPTLVSKGGCQILRSTSAMNVNDMSVFENNGKMSSGKNEQQPNSVNSSSVMRFFHKAKGSFLNSTSQSSIYAKQQAANYHSSTPDGKLKQCSSRFSSLNELNQSSSIGAHHQKSISSKHDEKTSSSFLQHVGGFLRRSNNINESAKARTVSDQDVIN